MDKKACPEGKRFDILVKSCITRWTRPRASRRPTEPPVVQVKPTSPAPGTSSGLSPAPGMSSRMSLSLSPAPGTSSGMSLSPSPAPETSSGVLLSLSPALWGVLLLVNLGVVLVFALSFILLRWRRHRTKTLKDSEQQDHLTKADHPTAPPADGDIHPEAPPACTHLDPWDRTGSERGFVICRCFPKHAGMEAELEQGQAAGSVAREHRVPLPATELGGTVLVTTKTV